jgi:hypothetical protein
MIILAHRGLWQSAAEKNSPAALRRALEGGFGVETDVRDLGGQLVISHDPPQAGAMSLDEFLETYGRIASGGMLALNITADGLQQALADALARQDIGPDSYFVFDMAVPDAIGYLRRNMPCFTRQSEIEPVPAFVDQASGIWLDCFRNDWINGPEILGHCGTGRPVALVSPELHGRDRRGAWKTWRESYRELKRHGLGERMMICTDHPHEARAYFDAAD